MQWSDGAAAELTNTSGVPLASALPTDEPKVEFGGNLGQHCNASGTRYEVWRKPCLCSWLRHRPDLEYWFTLAGG